MRDAMGAPLSPNEHTRYKREMELVRTQLGEEEFAKAMREGRAMSTEEAIEYALNGSVSSQA